MVQTAIVIVEPGKANLALAELAQAKATIVSVQPIQTGHIAGWEDLLVTFTIEHESEDAQFAFLSWLEDALGPLCKIF